MKISKITLLTIIGLSVFTAAGAFAQARDYDEWFGGNLMLVDLIDAEKGYCLDLEGYASITDTSRPVIVHSCKLGYWKDGTWRVNYPEEGQVYLPEYDLCLAAPALEEEAVVILEPCSGSQMQRFVFRDDGKIEIDSGTSNSLCLAVGEVSRATGNNLRRQTRFASCDDTSDTFTQWILPAEDAVYTDFEFTPLALLADAGQGGAGGPPIGNLFRGACAPCHGPAGDGLASEFAPKLTGQEDWYLSRQLTNFVSEFRGGHEGERWATQMSFHIADFTQAQLDSFVEHIGSLEDISAPVTIEGDIARGEQLYTGTCAACHGPEAMGNQGLGSPRLAGMADWYMVIQLDKFRNNLRGDKPQDIMGLQMALFAKSLPDEQALLDVTAYINTLAP